MSETSPEWNKQDPLSPQQVSDHYLQQVNTAQLVLYVREAVESALKSGMQFSTAIGTLHLMIREVEDLAIAELEKEA